MTDERELQDLIRTARSLGATVTVNYRDNEAEGRMLVDSVSVIAEGVGIYPMSPIACAERLREWNWMTLHQLVKVKGRYVKKGALR